MCCLLFVTKVYKNIGICIIKIFYDRSALFTFCSAIFSCCPKHLYIMFNESSEDNG